MIDKVSWIYGRLGTKMINSFVVEEEKVVLLVLVYKLQTGYFDSNPSHSLK